jgi:cytochrome b561
VNPGDKARRDFGAPPQGWGAVIVVLHWLSAILILVLLVLGWFMVHGDSDAATKFDLYQRHKSLGFLSLALLLARVLARFGSASPPLPRDMPRWEQRSAHIAHIAFYVLLLIAGLSGWLLVSAAIIAIPTRFFDLFVIPNLFAPNAAMQFDMTLLHYITTLMLAALIVLHVAAALKHYFLDRDDILPRMLRLRRRS